MIIPGIAISILSNLLYGNTKLIPVKCRNFLLVYLHSHSPPLCYCHLYNIAVIANVMIIVLYDLMYFKKVKKKGENIIYRFFCINLHIYCFSCSLILPEGLSYHLVSFPCSSIVLVSPLSFVLQIFYF